MKLVIMRVEARSMPTRPGQVEVVKLPENVLDEVSDHAIISHGFNLGLDGSGLLTILVDAAPDD